MKDRLERSSGVAKTLLVLGIMVGLTGCAAHRTLSRAAVEEQKGHWDLAVLEYSKAYALDPDDPKIKMALERAKFNAANEHFQNGKIYRAAGNLDLALIELQMAVALDPTNSYAQVELDKAKQEKSEIDRLGRELTPIERLKKETKGAMVTPPMLDARSDAPISLSFPKDTSVKDIYTALGKAAGINILFDPQLKDDKVTVELQDVTFQRALEIVMRQSNHFYKVLDEHTIIIAADTPQNRKDYEDLVIKTFFLSSGDVKEVMNVLRTLIEARRVAMNQQLNAIVIRDTIDKVAVAERIIDSNDKAKAEVVVDVELLQVNSSRIRELGVDLSSTAISQSLSPVGFSDTDKLRWNDVLHLNVGDWVFGGIPGFTYTFLKNNGEATLLAKPQLRITEGEKATLTIGDRVPIPTTTFNTAAGTIGTNIVPITSFQYQDVGIKIDIEPRVHHNREVTLKLTAEVSQLGASVDVGNGQKQPTIGTRTITSVIRLKDGESNFLAGLIRTDRQSSRSGIPFLEDIPVIGRLFSKQSDNEQRTDVLLTLTPHIVRMPDITEEDLLPIWVGTENNISFRGSQRIESPALETPFGESRPLVPTDEAPGGLGPSQLRGRPLVQTPKGPGILPRGGQGGGRRPPTAQGTEQVGPDAVDGNGDGAKVERNDVQIEPVDDPGAAEPATDSATLEAVPAGSPILRVELPEHPTVGREIEAKVVMSDPSKLAAFDASLIYDAAAIEILSVDTSSAVHGEGSGFAVDRIPGVIRFSWSAPPKGPGGEPLVAVIHLRALRPGEADFVWSGGLGRGSDGKPTSFAVEPATAVFESKAFVDAEDEAH